MVFLVDGTERTLLVSFIEYSHLYKSEPFETVRMGKARVIGVAG
jgi:hypothetical protein